MEKARQEQAKKKAAPERLVGSTLRNPNKDEDNKDDNEDDNEDDDYNDGDNNDAAYELHIPKDKDAENGNWVVDLIKTGQDLDEATPKVVEYSRFEMYSMWKHVVYSCTVEGHKAAWRRMQTVFYRQDRIPKYLQTTYMSRATEWAVCYTNHLPNFGQRTTSVVESVNRALKSEGINGNSSVLQAIEASI